MDYTKWDAFERVQMELIYKTDLHLNMLRRYTWELQLLKGKTNLQKYRTEIHKQN